MAIPSTEPIELTPHTTAKWRRVLSEYPSPTWTLSYTFRQATVSLTVSATADNGGHLVTLTPTQTALFAATQLFWASSVTDGTDVYAIGAGRIAVQPDLTAAGSFDGRTQNEKDLAAVQAAIRALMAGGAVQSYTIGNRQLSRYSLADLIALETQLRTQVQREQSAARLRSGGPFFKHLETVFVEPD